MIQTRTFAYINAQHFNDNRNGHRMVATSLDGACGAIFAPQASFDDFVNCWVTDLLAGVTLFFSIYGDPDNFLMFLDLDIKISAASSNKLETRGTWMLHACRRIQTAVRSMFTHIPDNVFMMLVTERSAREVILGDGSRTVTLGYHVHWPYLNVSVTTAHLIRSRILYLLVVGDDDNPPIQPPDTTQDNWATIVDLQVFSNKPHLRQGAHHKAGKLQRKKNKQSFRECQIGSQHDHIFVVLDVNGAVLKTEMKRLNPLDSDHKLNSATLKSFLVATCIWALDALSPIRIPVCPPNYMHNYEMPMIKKLKYPKFIMAGDLDPDADKEQLTRFKHARAFAMKIGNFTNDELPPISEMKFSNTNGECITFATTSRWCQNKGDNHNSSNITVTVSRVCVCVF